MYTCIDIGGTAIKYGIADIQGKFALRESMPTEAKKYGGPGIQRKVFAIIDRAKKLYDIHGIAISTAGMVNSTTGCITYALEDSIPNYTGINWKTAIQDKFRLPISVENDVNCAALGELWQGAGRGCTSLFMITLGTSIGGCLIVNGQLVHGISQSAGEIAYMRVPAGRLHEHCSTTHLITSICRSKGLPVNSLDGREVFDLFARGDSITQKAIAMLIETLADAMTNIICVANPERIILGGGIMAQEVFLRPLIEEALRKRLPPLVYEATTIAFATTQNDAGILGALYHFLQEHKIAI